MSGPRLLLNRVTAVRAALSPTACVSSERGREDVQMDQSILTALFHGLTRPFHLGKRGWGVPWRPRPSRVSVFVSCVGLPRVLPETTADRGA